MSYFIISVVIVTGCVLLFLWKHFRNHININLSGKHVLVTGGSSGIGKAVAIEVLKRGANVSIFARNQQKLEETKEELNKYILNKNDQEVFVSSVDISNDFGSVERAVQQATKQLGAVFLLVNCAGTSVSYRFEETPLQDFQRMMNVNYFGSINVTKAVLQHMKKSEEGKLVFVSSLAGLLGLYGYTAYSASKFALVGFAEALQMEIKPYNISVTISFPPDTDTPGFLEEEKTKPLETKAISESGGLVSAEKVASQIVNDALLGKFTSVVGIEGLALATACAGMMPVSSMFEGIFQVLTMGLFRIVGLVFLRNCEKTIQKLSIEKEKFKKDK